MIELSDSESGHGRESCRQTLLANTLRGQPKLAAIHVLLCWMAEATSAAVMGTFNWLAAVVASRRQAAMPLC